MPLTPADFIEILEKIFNRRIVYDDKISDSKTVVALLFFRALCR